MFRDLNKLIEGVCFESMGEPSKDKNKIKAYSPALRAEEIKAPSLLIAGTHDTRVSYKQTKAMRRALKRADVDVEFMKAKYSQHNVFSWKPHAREGFKRIEAFLAKHL